MSWYIQPGAQRMLPWAKKKVAALRRLLRDSGSTVMTRYYKLNGVIIHMKVLVYDHVEHVRMYAPEEESTLYMFPSWNGPNYYISLDKGKTWFPQYGVTAGTLFRGSWRLGLLPVGTKTLYSLSATSYWIVVGVTFGYEYSIQRITYNGTLYPTVETVFTLPKDEFFNFVNYPQTPPANPPVLMLLDGGVVAVKYVPHNNTDVIIPFVKNAFEISPGPGPGSHPLADVSRIISPGAGAGFEYAIPGNPYPFITVGAGKIFMTHNPLVVWLPDPVLPDTWVKDAANNAFWDAGAGAYAYRYEDRNGKAVNLTSGWMQTDTKTVMGYMPMTSLDPTHIYTPDFFYGWEYNFPFSYPIDHEDTSPWSKLTTNGLDYTQVNMNIFAPVMAGRNGAWLGLQDINDLTKLYRSDDLINFSIVATTPAGAATRFLWFDSGVVYAYNTTGAESLKSEDDGVSWGPVATPDTGGETIITCMITGARSAIIATRFAIYGTTDEGNTWELLTTVVTYWKNAPNVPAELEDRDMSLFLWDHGVLGSGVGISPTLTFLRGFKYRDQHTGKLVEDGEIPTY